MKKFAVDLLNQPIDVSKNFMKLENDYFILSKGTFNKETMTGMVTCERHGRKPRLAFNEVISPFEKVQSWEFPPAYEEDMTIPYSLSFVNDRTLRFKLSTKKDTKKYEPSLMLLDGDVRGAKHQWQLVQADENLLYYKGVNGSVTINLSPFAIEIRDNQEHLITKTLHMGDGNSLINSDPMPFSFIRCANDYKRQIAASFQLTPGEKIYGCGESFTKLDKRGQKVVLYTSDALGCQSQEMYKPIPFYMSSKGYGMFMHTSAPVTCDFGHTFDGASTLYMGDDELDVFIFLGTPKEILTQYTDLTGKSPVPPKWSFGLWMSRITYKSEEEARAIANKIREHRIPCDVLHLDTGWFEEDWMCDYQFSRTRFDDAKGMIDDLNKEGFQVSLWQLPYFTPKNPLFMEAIEKGYVVTDPDGGLPTEDAIIDFSNKEAVIWYQKLLKNLFDRGVGAIKVDFGEAAPLKGQYASKRSGWYEHNLYPLRYNKAVAEITQTCNKESIIWGRSAWAGSQRYPIHWGGDAQNTDNGMAATLRGGLSLGLSGFSFWSHDIGGFVKESPEELYRRWLPFGMLTSHSRCHGAPPTEPWLYNEAFLDAFRESVELKYKLLPYIYTQSIKASELGHPLLRTLFFEFPDDQQSWFIEDEYLLGESLLVAPLFEENATKRHVYLPPGIWHDYQTGIRYEGARWVAIESSEIPCIIMVRNGAIIQHGKLAQSTAQMDWDNIIEKIYS